MKADTEILPWKAFFAPSLEQDCCLQGQEDRTGFHQAAPRDISCVDWACSFPLQILQRAGEYSLNTEHSRNFFCRMRDCMELPWKKLMVYKVKWHPAFLYLVVWLFTLHCFLPRTLIPFIVQNGVSHKGEKRARGGTCNL